MTLFHAKQSWHNSFAYQPITQFHPHVKRTLWSVYLQAQVNDISSKIV